MPDVAAPHFVHGLRRGATAAGAGAFAEVAVFLHDDDDAVACVGVGGQREGGGRGEGGGGRRDVGREWRGNQAELMSRNRNMSICMNHGSRTAPLRAALAAGDSVKDGDSVPPKIFGHGKKLQRMW